MEKPRVGDGAVPNAIAAEAGDGPVQTLRPAEDAYALSGQRGERQLAVGRKLGRRLPRAAAGFGRSVQRSAVMPAASIRGAMRVPYTIVLTDNRGYGCINRLQIECGGAEFNNMYKDSNVEVQPEIDFVAHARSVGAHAVKAADLPALEAETAAARNRGIPTVVVTDTNAVPGTGAGGHWWDVAVPQTGGPERLEKAPERYTANAALQRTYN